jgi:hypothetical protein
MRDRLSVVVSQQPYIAMLPYYTQLRPNGKAHRARRTYYDAACHLHPHHGRMMICGWYSKRRQKMRTRDNGPRTLE